MADLVTLEDVCRTRILLEHLHDWLPAPPPSNPVPDAGVQPGRWLRCSVCAATGRVTGEGARAKPCRSSGSHRHHHCRPCLGCDGEGWVKARQPRQGAPVGEHRMTETGVHELHEAALSRADRDRRMVADIARIRQLLRIHAGLEAEGDWLDRAVERKERHYQRASFGPLERALEQLALTSYPVYVAVMFYRVDEQQPVRDPRVEERLVDAERWLAERMPRPIWLGTFEPELARWKHALQHGRTEQHRRARCERNEEIRRLRHVEGWSLRRIGSLYDLSAEGVRKILDEADAGVVATAISGPAA